MFVKNLKKVALTSSLACSLIFVPKANADLVDAFENGGFEGGTINTNMFNSQVPPGWETTGGTPDVFDENTNFAEFTWGASSTDGQFLHGIGFDNYTESAVQAGLDGLVVGQEYEISFEQAISNCYYSNDGGYWDIKFGDEVQSSAQMDIPDGGEFEGWNWQTMTFTATSTIQTLEVSAMSNTGGRTDIGIDGFFLGDPGTNPDKPTNSVPEPSVLALLGLGVAGIGFVRRKKKL